MMNIGVVISKRCAESYRSQIEDCYNLIFKYIIEDTEEKVLVVKQMFGSGTFEIITDKAKYKTYRMSEYIKGCRWQKVFTYGEMSIEDMQRIEMCLRPLNAKNCILKLF